MTGTVISCGIFCFWLVWPLGKLGTCSEMQCLKDGRGRDPHILPEVNLGNGVGRENLRKATTNTFRNFEH